MNKVKFFDGMDNDYVSADLTTVPKEPESSNYDGTVFCYGDEDKNAFGIDNKYEELNFDKDSFESPTNY